MKSFHMRSYTTEADYQKIKSFLQETFFLNQRLEHSWHIARLDHWRWHAIKTCQGTPPVDQVTKIWETEDGKIAAVLHPICHDEIRLHVHPQYRSDRLEEAMLVYAEEHFSDWIEDGKKILYVPVFSDDTQRQELLKKRGYQTKPGWGHHWRRDLTAELPPVKSIPGYTIRAMGGKEDHPARSWASWRAFHAEEPNENYDGDYSWYQNMQSAPLYRNDLDIITESDQGEIASFCTISYDPGTQSAVCVLVGTAFEHQQKGLAKAAMIEGFHRLKNLGATRVFATAHIPAADALYGSVMDTYKNTDTWIKII